MFLASFWNFYSFLEFLLLFGILAVLSLPSEIVNFSRCDASILVQNSVNYLYAHFSCTV
jgi:hypothetical protein